MTLSSISPPTSTQSLIDHFLLRRDVTFLNHGSFGACPRPVFDRYQQWQRELEEEPIEFLGRRLEHLLSAARQTLADYLHTAPDTIVFVPNATFGLNVVARSLVLEPGDEVLSTDHEYGAADRTWRFNCAQRGARYVNQRIPLPITSEEAVVDALWQGVTPRTRVIFVSHITSPTALQLPVAAICRRARQENILTVVDGAHAPGQIDLDLTALDADFYTGNCHKWLCAPKGSGFLYARPDCQTLLKPLVVSWGWESPMPGASPFHDHFDWLGTHDPAAYLSVPAAIAFQEQHDWAAVRAACHTLGEEARSRVEALTGLEPICPADGTWWNQMCALPLPTVEGLSLQHRLWQEFRIEVPVTTWYDRQFLRVSIQAYNTRQDVDRLVDALEQVLTG